MSRLVLLLLVVVLLLVGGMWLLGSQVEEQPTRTIEAEVSGNAG